jgi:RNase adaptor protein for sRNA GlmZ degradation
MVHCATSQREISSLCSLTQPFGWRGKKERAKVGKLLIKFISAGVKSGPLPPADYYLDCRVVYNPFHDPTLAGKTGDDLSVQLKVRELSPSVDAMRDLLREAIRRIPTRRKGEGKDPYEKPFVVCCFCAHGIHRSRSVKHLLSRDMIAAGFKVEVV